MPTLIEGVDVTAASVPTGRRDFRLVRTQRVAPDRLGIVLAPRRRSAVPAVHVRQWLHHDLPAEQRAQPARHRSGGSSPTSATSWGPTSPSGTPSLPSFRWPSDWDCCSGGPCDPRSGVSFFWAFGVWFFGEGLGQLFTGSASALTGAPGSVLLYGLIGLMAWPRSAPTEERTETRTERRHRVLGRGTGHRRGGDSAPGVVRVLVAGGDPVPAPRQPDPDVGVECDHGHVVGGAERVLPLSQQLRQPLRQRRRRGPRGCWPSAPWSSDSGPWCSADRLRSSPPVASWRPSSGSAVRVSAASSPAREPTRTRARSSCSWRWPWCRPCCRIRRSWRSPFSTALFRYPVVVLGSLVALVAGLFLSAAYPVAAQESTGTAMAGMTGMSGATSGSGGGTATTATCTRGNNGATEDRAGRPRTPRTCHGRARNRS